jgi:Tol biopolymer transport system component
MEQPLARITVRIGAGLLTLATVLSLLALVAGHLLPAGEALILTLPGRFSLGVYLLDLQHHLLYPIDEVATGQYVLNPADKDWVAHSANPSGNWDIVLTNLFTGESRRLTGGSGFDGQPSWSADGRWIAFLSDRGGAMNIYGVGVGGGVPKRLSRGVPPKYDPAWSPDGKRLAFGARDSNGSVSLYVTDVVCLAENITCPQNVIQLTSSTRGDYQPTWSPDGRWIAFLSDRGGRTDVYIVDTGCLDTAAGCIQQNARQLTHDIRATRALSWSPDGHSLRFIAEYTNQPVLYRIALGCDLLPEGCVPQVLLSVGS